MFRRLAMMWRRSAPAVAVSAPATLHGDTAAVGVAADAWVADRIRERRLYVGVPDAHLSSLRADAHNQAAAAIAAAERVLGHEFDLLGSGPFLSRDPDRAGADYQPIDWYFDPVQRLRFPRGVPHREWKLLEMRPGTADVKHPWELARCQHFAVLGQAFRLTRDHRFAIELVREIADFVDANPVGFGINWTCTMDVALRAVNWAIGLELIADSSAVDRDEWMRAYAALFDHGAFIRANLENTYEVTSNHFLSNLAGLWFLGAAFAGLPTARDWSAFAREGLEREIDVQVLSDGADFESSIPYHRLVTELFLGCLRLGDAIGEPLSPRCRERIGQMVAYLAAVLRPDGLMPQVGDADDGRLHVLGGYGATSRQDPRHLFGPASVMFGVPDCFDLAGENGRWETAWWGLDADRPPPDRAEGAAPPSASRLFPDAGVAVARGGSAYLLVTNGCVGTKGFGNHKHNDQLSFEYHHRGVALVVDPGSYVYTADGNARNLFRSTRSHNTLAIDGVEQNEMRTEWLFRLFESARPVHVSFGDGDRFVEYVGRHYGYERLAQSITHERTFRLDKTSGALQIVDRLIGSGAHSIRWHFHLAPGVEARVAPGSVELSAAGRAWLLQAPPDFSFAIAPAHYSPSYGVRVDCLGLDATVTTTVDGEAVYSLAITPCD